MVVAVLNQKGGVGKTTLATNLAAAQALAGRQVLYVDADPQASALDWNTTRQIDPLFNVVAFPKNTLHRDIPKLSAPYDWTFIDGPPLVFDVAKSAIMASDFILIPVQPSAFDIWSAKKIVDLVGEAQMYKPHLQCAFVINRKPANTAVSRGFRPSLEAGFPEIAILRAEIGQRVAFVESAAQGLTVLETEPRSLAAQEIRKLSKEITEMTHATEDRYDAAQTAVR